MIVLHILLIILKLLGILLLVIFGLLLLVLLSMLLCPVGYRLQGTKSQEGCQGTVMVYWLFHLISVKGFSEGREKKTGIFCKNFRDSSGKAAGLSEKERKPKEAAAFKKNAGGVIRRCIRKRRTAAFAKGKGNCSTFRP